MSIKSLIKKLQSYEKSGVKKVFFQDDCWNNYDVEFEQLQDDTVCVVVNASVED